MLRHSFIENGRETLSQSLTKMIIPITDDSPRYRMQYVTFGLIAINVLIHIYMLSLDYDRQEWAVRHFASMGAFFNPLRSISGGFLHADLFHLLGNMWFLFLFGSAVEGKLGHLWMSVLYALCLLLSDAAQHFLSPVQYEFCIGASGAVGGLAGAFWFLFSRAKVVFFYWIFFIYVGTVSVSVTWTMLYLFGFDALWFMLGTPTGVAHGAHLGGLVSGVLCGLVLRHSGYVTLDGEDMLTRFVIWRGRRKWAALSRSEAGTPAQSQVITYGAEPIAPTAPIAPAAPIRPISCIPPTPQVEGSSGQGSTSGSGPGPSAPDEGGRTTRQEDYSQPGEPETLPFE